MATVTVTSSVALPNSGDVVSFTLIEDGGAPVAFAAELFLGGSSVEATVPFGKDKAGKAYEMHPATALRGMKLAVAGYVMGLKKDTIRVRCQFTGAGAAKYSDWAVIKTTTKSPRERFYINTNFT